MKSAVIVFPGSNRDHDMLVALETITGRKPLSIWHAETELPPVDLIVLPGGFSYGAVSYTHLTLPTKRIV